MLRVGKKFAFYSSAMGEPLEVFKQERNKTALTIFKDPVAVWAVGGDGTEIKAGRSDGEATAVVQRRDDGGLGQGVGHGDGVMRTDLGFILKVEPMGLDGLKGKRMREREEWRMPFTFSI